MNVMINPTTLFNFNNAALQSATPYTPAAYLNDIKKEVWKPFGKNELANSLRRSLQRSYVEKLQFIVNPKQVKDGWIKSSAQRDDTRLTVIAHVKKLRAEIPLMTQQNPGNAAHFQDIKHELDKILHEMNKL
jgi:hypothetical protein